MKMSRQVRRSLLAGKPQSVGFQPVEGKKFALECAMIRRKGGVPLANLRRIKPSKSDSAEYRQGAR